MMQKRHVFLNYPDKNDFKNYDLYENAPIQPSFILLMVRNGLTQPEICYAKKKIPNNIRRYKKSEFVH